MADALLRCEGVTYAYAGRFAALDGVSVDIAAGELVAVLGANGSGKSTLLKVLDGLVFAQSGTYHAYGAKISEHELADAAANREFRSRVGFVFQNSDAQVFSPTVRDEIAFGPLCLGLDPSILDARVADVMRMLEIEHLADRTPQQLSGGQKKRVAIASVLVMNPDTVLFDEPTAALDPRAQMWCAEFIGALSRAGRTIVIATHDLALVAMLGARCVVFGEDHRIAADGPAAEVLADRELLLAVNLIHEHAHAHGPILHSHEHSVDHHGDHEALLIDAAPERIQQ